MTNSYVRKFHFHWEEDAPIPDAVGGFFWDGRADSIAALVRRPLLNPDEMGNRSEQPIAETLHAARSMSWLGSSALAAVGCGGAEEADKPEVGVNAESQALSSGESSKTDADKRTRTPIKHVLVIIGENRTFDHVYATYQPKHNQRIWNLLAKGIIHEDGSPGDAPYFKLLADTYAMSDNFHQSIQGGTGANHVALGTGDAIWFSDGKDTASAESRGVTTATAGIATWRILQAPTRSTITATSAIRSSTRPRS
jgi:hypothetical protein